MQDLIINRAISVRRVTGITTVAQDVWRIPPGIDRVWLTVTGSGSGDVLALYLDDSFGSRISGIEAVNSSDLQLFQTVLSADSLPGIFSGPLYCNDADGEPVAYEGYYDPPLARAVSDGYGTLLKEFG